MTQIQRSALSENNVPVHFLFIYSFILQWLKELQVQAKHQLIKWLEMHFTAARIMSQQASAYLCVCILEKDQSAGWDFLEKTPKSSCSLSLSQNKKRHGACIHWTCTSTSSRLFEARRLSRFRALKCHRPTSAEPQSDAKMAFINVIHPPWMAATTTEEPCDIW